MKKRRSTAKKRVAGSRKRTRPDPARRGLRAVADSPLDVGEKDLPPTATGAFPIVGIGASAGGIEALKSLLERIPPGIEMAFVVVQHLSPHQESLLPSVLSTTTRLPVSHAEKRTKVEPGHVYVVPPNRFIELTDGHLRLTERPDDRSQFTPIDHFFTSLGTFGQTRAIGVVLSGNASDGALGLRDIKAAGGIAMAQDPITARFDSMPRAAIASGVDFVLNPAQLGEELVRLARHPLLRRLEGPRAHRRRTADDPGAELQTVLRLLRESGGVDFSSYRTPTIIRRLHRQMVLRKIATVGEYIELLKKDPSEAVSLNQSILIHVTRFFRDPGVFDALAALSARLAQSTGSREPIRIWVPGCSTGEEAYSVAMTLIERLGSGPGTASIQVFGTDVSNDAIDRARSAVYPQAIESDVSPERLTRFFTRVDHSYRIAPSVRDLCIFARQDVTHDPPFSHLDLVVCRNLFIYLDLPLQKRILNLFYYALKPSGLLLLGTAESTGAEGDLFEPVDRKHRIFSKKPGTLVHKQGIPLTPYFPRGGFRADAAEPRTETKVQKDADRILLEKYTPPAVVLDDSLRITQVRGKVGRWLALGPGSASLSILKMAQPGLAPGLRAVLERARRSHKPARKVGLRVRTDSHVEELTIEVIPMSTKEAGQNFLVLFEPTSRQAKAGKGREPGGAGRASKRVRELEHDLEGTRTEMQSVIQELEAANQDLQSANEEVLSSNEELQSTNEELDTAREELQSTNEEIITVNEELHARNEALTKINSDLVNLLTSVQIAIVMVDRDLRIQHFTPLSEKVLNILPSDVGRPISHLRPNIDCPMLVTLIQNAMDSGKSNEQITQDSHGRWYSLKVQPYANIQGAVVVLVDVDRLMREQHEAAVTDALVADYGQAVAVVDSEFRFKYASAALRDLLQLDRGDEAAHSDGSLFEIDHVLWDVPGLRAALGSVLSEGAVVRDLRVVQSLPHQQPRTLVLSARKLNVQDGRGPRIVISARPGS